ncbi:hypothetical protein [Nitrosospira briensis]|uniref:hypothetical protein n=1 Tax=Nitrosospira briensis TaxID=35799 RepID=UPI0008E8C2D9|nr:hypothetical protein [Nitrosospira briensis]SFN74488.1 hypothetical protein SAMN05216332_101455 [Nitrosospira briensis]
MEKERSVLSRAVKSGTISGLAAAAVASMAGKRENGSYAAPLNATSHIIWGDKAEKQDQASLKYTLTGFLLNYGSAIFWASFYEKLAARGGNGRSEGRVSSSGAADLPPVMNPLCRAAAVAAAAYVIDYHVIPKRFTPGFEKRLSGKSMAVIFFTLAAGLASRDLVDIAKGRSSRS